MQLTMLGTGHALVTECYNTCFVLSEDHKHFLVDGGGGNTILKQLKSADIDLRDIHDIFVTHKHIDHILGIIWVIRAICQQMNKKILEQDVRLYAGREVIQILDYLCQTLLNKKESRFIGDRLLFISIKDREEQRILDRRIIFFDIHSTKASQFGFTLYLNDKEKLSCCGDEPYNDSEKDLVSGSKWLMHEAFCLESEAFEFKPHEKHHSTAAEAGQLAERLGAENLILYHTEDKNLACRKILYGKESSKWFHGNLYIPDDLERIEL
ncbi:ribonuclease Z [uncultured Roseburia sp.]|uniref:MBL fold metallo-hydrolase n=1 Tax=Brotonthovivens ammoniilytica TaxID=2981725 RepID=A0ABT2TGC2_9FIRM|nr:MBL fold metallo-hydrolase [Brotonthovivens ammoniilytica]MCU6761243.1 MBL fold metallo-hydrolase [Brotonthovivens ammoniilytica]SCI23034.1 ribonuclease Z [uncultured Roseburia sp.]